MQGISALRLMYIRTSPGYNSIASVVHLSGYSSDRQSARMGCVRSSGRNRVPRQDRFYKLYLRHIQIILMSKIRFAIVIVLVFIVISIGAQLASLSSSDLGTIGQTPEVWFFWWPVLITNSESFVSYGELSIIWLFFVVLYWFILSLAITIAGRLLNKRTSPQ